jgi:hypothetical protein
MDLILLFYIFSFLAPAFGDAGPLELAHLDGLAVDEISFFRVLVVLAREVFFEEALTGRSTAVRG